jgi:hypothetical protein
VTLAFGAEMLVNAGLETDRNVAHARCVDALASGRAAETFGRMVHELCGPADFMDKAAHYLPRAKVEIAIEAEDDGYLAACDTRALGLAVVAVVSGRATRSTMVLACPVSNRLARGSPRVSQSHSSRPTTRLPLRKPPRPSRRAIASPATNPQQHPSSGCGSAENRAYCTRRRTRCSAE